MAVQSLPLTLEAFHQLYDGAKPAYEYWHGAAVQKSMPTGLHGVVQLIIMVLLEQAGWNAASEVRLKLSAHLEPVPDVIATRGRITSSYPTSAPELCIEILSPGDRLSRALDEAGDYIRYGADSVWILDPDKRTAWTLSRERDSEPSWISPGGSLRIGETAIHLSSLFAEVDRKLEDGPSLTA